MSDRGGRRALPADDDRHRRAGPRVRRPATRRRARGARSRRARTTGCRSRRSASARTCSPRTTGVDVLVLQSRGRAGRGRGRRRARPRRRRRGERGLPPPSARRRARRLRVRLRDPGDGRWGSVDERRRLRKRLRDGDRRALVATADGTGWLTPAELGLSYRHSSLRHGQVVAQVEYQLMPRDRDEIRATVARAGRSPQGAQPTKKRTFGSVFKNPEHELGAGRCSRRAASRAIGSAAR